MFVCQHPNTTILDDRKYCIDCGEEIIEPVEEEQDKTVEGWS